MKDRIEIDGTWYVRERDVSDVVTEPDITFSKQIELSGENFNFELSIVGDSFEDCRLDPSMSCRNYTKSTIGTSFQYIDNSDWLIDLYRGKIAPYPTDEELEEFTDTDIDVMKQLIKKGIELGWFENERL